jgi:type II secretory pathway component GspD/PulD (secretin)
MKGTKILLATIMGITMIAGAPMVAMAQDETNKTVTLDIDQADVREALRALFKSMNVSYSVSPEVQGIVTVNVKNVPFETALQNILKQVTATYRIVGGVYEVIPREADIKPEEQTPIENTQVKATVRRKVFVSHADPQFIATLIGQSQTNFNLHPEMSTVLGAGNGNSGGGFGNGNNNFGGGNQNQGFNGSQGFNGNQNGGNRGNQSNRGPRG